ncbi:PREDICTED: uncharacterized protein LOC101300841 [Fragaria vesca subsp. vesca]
MLGGGAAGAQDGEAWKPWRWCPIHGSANSVAPSLSYTITSPSNSTLSLLLRAVARVSVNCAGSSLRLNKPRASPLSNNAQISVFNLATLNIPSHLRYMANFTAVGCSIAVNSSSKWEQMRILVFASVMATLGLQVILESMRTLFFDGVEFNLTKDHERWVVGSMLGVTLVKLLLMLYCRTFSNKIVKAYS